MLKGLRQWFVESDRRVPVFLRQMWQRHRQFLKGMVVGILLASLLGYVWNEAVNWWRFRGWEQRMESRLKAPPFPTGIKIDYNWTLQTLDGQEFQFADLAEKVVLLNFWATWCSPCRIEMPSMQALYDSLKDEKNLAFLFVSDEKEETVRKFIEENDYNFPVYLMEGTRPEAFEGRGIPATFLLSKDQTIAFRHVGSAKWDEQVVFDFLENLLN